MLAVNPYSFRLEVSILLGTPATFCVYIHCYSNYFTNFAHNN